MTVNNIVFGCYIFLIHTIDYKDYILERDSESILSRSAPYHMDTRIELFKRGPIMKKHGRLR